MQLTARKVGNSTGVLLPVALGIREGDRLLVTGGTGEFTVRRIDERMASIIALTEQTINEHDEILARLEDGVGDKG